MKGISLMTFFILLTACSSGIDKLRTLCEKHAGLTIHKTVEAEGFYNAYSNSGITNHLIKGPYRFYEFCDDSPSKSKNTFFPEPGCFRVKKIRRDSGQCDERIDKGLSKFVVDPYPGFLKDHCIAVEKLEKPEARYKYEVERDEWWINERDETKMILSIGRIVNSETGEILGERKSYILAPKRSNPPSFHCGSPQVTGLKKSQPFASGLIEKTLIPIKDEESGESK